MPAWIDREWAEQYKYSKGDKVTRTGFTPSQKLSEFDARGRGGIVLGGKPRYDGVGKIQECYGHGGYTDNREISYLVLWNNGTYGTYGESSLDMWVEPPLTKEDTGKLIIKFDRNKEGRMTGTDCSIIPERLI